MQEEAVTLIVSRVGIFGTLGGIIVGHLLMRSWQREQWLRDCKKEEFSELLAALADSLRAELAFFSRRPLGPEEEASLIETHSNAMRVVRSRIFTAETVAQLGIEQRWPEAMQKYNKTENLAEIVTVYEAFRSEIVRVATGKSITLHK